MDQCGLMLAHLAVALFVDGASTSIGLAQSANPLLFSDNVQKIGACFNNLQCSPAFFGARPHGTILSTNLIRQNLGDVAN